MLEINGKNLCGYCFSEIEKSGEKCPHCSSEKNNSKYPTALPEDTILAGRYIVGKVLGKGGFGITYLCYDTKENKKVAVKEYLPDHLTHRNTGETLVSTYSGETEEYFKAGAQKFFEEAKMVSKFNGNPNIISVYEFFYENNTTYFVMEYLDGVDLKTYIRSKGGKISEEEVLSVAEKVIQALMIVHSTDILHRDISPDNIFICNDGNVKLIDFGAARQVMGEASKSLSVVLKEGFAPPEQYNTRGKQGPWTDIYALGATLYYSLTGEVLDNAMIRVTDDSKLNLESVSPKLAGIITKMLEIKKEDRYQDTIELRQAFSALSKTVEEEKKDNEEQVTVIEKRKDLPFIAGLDAKTKKLILAVAGSVAVVIISVIVAVSLSNKNNVTESSGGNNSDNGTPTLNGTINVDEFTEENKTSATKEEKTEAEKEEKTTNKKNKTSTTKKQSTSATKNNKNPSSWTNQEILDYYNKAVVATDKKSPKGQKKMYLDDEITCDGNAMDAMQKILTPAFGSVLEQKSSATSDIPGYGTVRLSDIKSIKATEKNGVITIEILLKDQTDKYSTNRLSGSVERAIGTIGNIDNVFGDMDVVITNGKETSSLTYTNATIKVNINEKTGLITNGTWHYLVNIFVGKATMNISSLRAAVTDLRIKIGYTVEF